jgi:hypothetical protein
MCVVKRTKARRCLVGALLAALALITMGCGGSTTHTVAAPPVTVALPPAADADTIAATFVMFFDGARPVAERTELLENGQQFVVQLETMSASAVGKTVSVDISSISTTSASTAEVRFSILVGGEPAVSEQTGKAVLQDGEWKVAAETFLAVLAQVTEL